MPEAPNRMVLITLKEDAQNGPRESHDETYAIR